MGQTHFEQLKGLPSDVKQHGINNVYTKDEIAQLLTDLGVGGSGGNGIVNINLIPQSGTLDSETNQIPITIPEFSIDDQYFLYIGGAYKNEDEFYIDHLENNIVKQSGFWEAGTEYDFVIINGTTPEGASIGLESYKETGVLVAEQTEIDITIPQYNQDHDYVMLFIGGLFKTQGDEYTLDTLNKKIIDNNIDFQAGYVYDIIIFKDVGGGAIQYEHPATHPATMITEDGNHRFVTDAQIAFWNTPTADTYDHPDSHPATMITEDSNHRFVTAQDISNWNSMLEMEEYEHPDTHSISMITGGVHILQVYGNFVPGASAFSYSNAAINEQNSNVEVYLFGGNFNGVISCEFEDGIVRLNSTENEHGMSVFNIVIKTPVDGPIDRWSPPVL